MRYLLGFGYAYNTEGRCELHQHPGHTVPVIEWKEPADDSKAMVSYCRFCSLNLGRTLWPLKDHNAVMQKWNTATSVATSARAIGKLSTELRGLLLNGVA